MVYSQSVWLFAASLMCSISISQAREVPSTVDQVAAPGGKLPGKIVIQLEKVAEGFVDPVNVASAGDDSGRLFVVERAGRIMVIGKDGEPQVKPFLDLTRLAPTAIDPQGNVVQSGFIEQGLFSVAFHPEYQVNGFLFVHYTSLRFNGAGVVVRYQVDPDSPDEISAERARETEKVLMRIDQPSVNNNGGEIAFGPDEMLYVGLGDGGFDAPTRASQELSTRLGKILRINVDVEEAYQAPDDNPFADNGGTPQDEIWITGLHNPYKFSFDVNGDLFITDVGDDHWEEINFVAAGSGGAQNFGWPDMEGNQCHPIVGRSLDQPCDVGGLLPVAQYPHPSKEASATDNTDTLQCASAQGLGVANYDGMDGVYMVGDWCSGVLYGLGWDGKKWQFEELLKTDLHITAGGSDDDGKLLLLSAKFYFDDEDPMRPPFRTVWRVQTK